MSGTEVLGAWQQYRQQRENKKKERREKEERAGEVALGAEGWLYRGGDCEDPNVNGSYALCYVTTTVGYVYALTHWSTDSK